MKNKNLKYIYVITVLSALLVVYGFKLKSATYAAYSSAFIYHVSSLPTNFTSRLNRAINTMNPASVLGGGGSAPNFVYAGLNK